MVGVAVNVTEVPAHIVLPGAAAILTLTGNEGFTVIVMVLLVNGLPVMHNAFDVNSQVMISPLVKAALV